MWITLYALWIIRQHCKNKFPTMERAPWPRDDPYSVTPWWPMLRDPAMKHCSVTPWWPTLGDPAMMVWDWRVLRVWSIMHLVCYRLLTSYFFIFFPPFSLSLPYDGWLWMVVVRTDRVDHSLSRALLTFSIPIIFIIVIYLCSVNNLYHYVFN